MVIETFTIVRDWLEPTSDNSLPDGIKKEVLNPEIRPPEETYKPVLNYGAMPDLDTSYSDLSNFTCSESKIDFTGDSYRTQTTITSEELLEQAEIMGDKVGLKNTNYQTSDLQSRYGAGVLGTHETYSDYGSKTINYDFGVGQIPSKPTRDEILAHEVGHGILREYLNGLYENLTPYEQAVLARYEEGAMGYLISVKDSLIEPYEEEQDWFVKTMQNEQNYLKNLVEENLNFAYVFLDEEMAIIAYKDQKELEIQLQGLRSNGYDPEWEEISKSDLHQDVLRYSVLQERIAVMGQTLEEHAPQMDPRIDFENIGQLSYTEALSESTPYQEALSLA